MEIKMNFFHFISLNKRVEKSFWIQIGFFCMQWYSFEVRGFHSNSFSSFFLFSSSFFFYFIHFESICCPKQYWILHVFKNVHYHLMGHRIIIVLKQKTIMQLDSKCKAQNRLYYYFATENEIFLNQILFSSAYASRTYQESRKMHNQRT